MTTLISPISSARPTDLVFMSQTNDLVTDSFLVAKYFGKRHDNVLQKIRSLGCTKNFVDLNFKVCHKNNELQNGRLQPFYQMTKDGFVFLVMGFTGKRADEIKERYINAFNEMADQLKKPQQPMFTPLPENALQLPDFHYQRILLTVEHGNIISTKILSNEEQFLNTKQFINYFKEPCVALNQMPQLIELAKAVNDRILRLASK
ncbi:Rha family transcriptional regulator [Vibrio gangliei]|uniref:Rha family transcriptional regulator n=1 Tax=Vibrio gangliei TaxID=2077090 RepID=UPI000D020BF6|nr:Rha family transcriptional regulator [Vibrio gangliei]